jgi:hypothetical protein
MSDWRDRSRTEPVTRSSAGRNGVTTQPIALATVGDVDSKLAKDYKYC